MPKPMIPWIGGKRKLAESINDHPAIRELFSGWPVVEIDHKYTVGGGGAGKNCVELVYGTWSDGVPKPRAIQQGLF